MYQESDLAKTLLGTLTYMLVLNPAKTHSNGAQVLDVSLQNKFSERRDKVMVRSGLIQRDTHSTDRVWAIAEGKCGGFEIWCG